MKGPCLHHGAEANIYSRPGGKVLASAPPDKRLFKTETCCVRCSRLAEQMDSTAPAAGPLLNSESIRAD